MVGDKVWVVGALLVYSEREFGIVQQSYIFKAGVSIAFAVHFVSIFFAMGNVDPNNQMGRFFVFRERTKNFV